MALLEMVNSVRGKLREERITTISATDFLTTEIIELINDAGSEILEGDDWEFDVRHDGRLFLPSSQTGTTAMFGDSFISGNPIYDNGASVSLSTLEDTDSGEVFEDVDLAGFRCSGNSVRSRLLATGSDYPNTSWIITDVTIDASWLVLTLGSNLNLESDAAETGAWTTYANEAVLPATVKDVLSIRNEEEPLRLDFINRDLEFDARIPRPTDSFSGVPEVAIVGGTMTSTSRTTGTDAWTTISDVDARTGVGITVWPIPNTDIHLEYSYRVQHADLSADTDSWDGVPANVIRIIEWLAFQKALDSGIQNDPEAATRAERQVEKRRLRAQASQTRQPNLRRIPTSFGSRGGRNSRSRWATQSITAPS